KRDPLAPDIALDRWQARLAAVAGLGCRVEDVAEPVDRQPYLLEILPQLCQTKHRRRQLRRDHIERDELADREFIVNDELCPEEQNEHRHCLIDQGGALRRKGAKADNAKRRRDISGELLLPAQLQSRLERHRLESLDPSDRLNEKGLVLSTALELLVEPR